jgi:hypothetical protein
VKAMPWSSSDEQTLMEEFDKAYREGTWFNRKFLHKGKRIKPPEEVREQLGLDPSKKTAVIFSHVLWDATFFYGEGLFEDYESWLLETVRAAASNTKVNWIVKLHPDLVWKLKYEGYSGELQDVIALRAALAAWPDHIKIVLPDTDISSYSFFEITDYCVTVRGTIGIEMACHGIPGLTAGTGRYSGLGFTIDSASQEDYLRLITNIQDLSPMSRQQAEDARRFAYALFKRRVWNTESFEMVRLPIEEVGHPLDHDIHIKLTSFDEVSSAKDLREFANWVASNAVDYFQSPCS